jgi:hypothetical protein
MTGRLSDPELVQASGVNARFTAAVSQRVGLFAVVVPVLPS